MLKKILLGMLLIVSFGAANAADPVKMSKSGICHAPGSHYYNQTKHFTPYPTLKECLNAGGRMPKK